MKSKSIWAVDPFASDLEVQLSSLRALLELHRDPEAFIEPVCVLGPQHLQVSEITFNACERECRSEAELRLNRWIKRIGQPRLMSPTLLIESASSLGTSVDRLIEYARSTEASVIGVGTTIKGVAERWFLGSFAETLMLRSDVPLLISNPHNRTQNAFQKVLFPTDFSEPSKSAFHTLLKECTKTGREIVLYHKLDCLPPVPLEFVSGDGYTRYLEKEASVRRETGEKWAQIARDAGVKAESVVDLVPLPIIEAIYGAAYFYKVGLIAMAAQSKPVTAALLGSVARGTVRRSPVPVWVIHPRTEK